MKKTIHTILILFFLSPTTVLSQVDYEEDIQPIFNQYCIDCHGGTNGVTLTSYDAVMESVGAQYETEIVVPGEPGESPLVDKIEESPQFGDRMPQDGPPYLTNEESTLIRTWIDEGAHETPVANELITDIPEGFKLNGNYPNPFNPSTIVSFEVPEAVSYQLKIYTAHGALVETAAGHASPGEVSVKINLNSQPSGVYFYQVIAGTENKKYLLGSERMTLVK